MLVHDVEEFAEKLAGNVYDKLRKHLRGVVNSQKVTTYIVSSKNGSTDANGNLDLPIFNNTSGKHVVIGRVLLWADGYTPAAPFSGGWLALYSGQGFSPSDIFDMLPQNSGGQLLPNVASYSGHNALRLRMNESLSLHITSGPVSTNITGTVFGFLEPTDSDFDL